MNVKHLIKWLSRFDPEMEVVTMSHEKEIGNIDCVVPYTREIWDENSIGSKDEHVLILCNDFTFEEKL